MAIPNKQYAHNLLDSRVVASASAFNIDLPTTINGKAWDDCSFSLSVEILAYRPGVATTVVWGTYTAIFEKVAGILTKISDAAVTAPSGTLPFSAAFSAASNTAIRCAITPGSVDSTKFLTNVSIVVFDSPVQAIAWFEADQIPTSGLVEGNAIATWYDIRKYTNLTQAMIDKQPIWHNGTTAGLIGPNSKPFVRFDGSNDILKTAQWSPIVPQPVTRVMVIRNAALPGATRVIIDAFTDAANAVAIHLDGNYYLYAGTVCKSGQVKPGWQVVTTITNGTSNILRVNGANLPIAAGDVGAGACDGVTLGAQANETNFFSGDVAALAVFPGALSDTEIRALEDAFMLKYGINNENMSLLGTVAHDWDAANITNLADAAVVASVPDNISGGTALTAAGVAQPVYKIQHIAGMPAMVFDGVNTILAAAATQPQPFTVYYVCDSISAGGTHTLLDGVAPNRIAFREFSGAMTASGALNATVHNGPQIYCAIFNTTSTEVYRNGYMIMPSTGGAGAVSVNPIQIGGSSTSGGQWQGHIAKTVVFTGAHDATTRGRVEVALSARYGLIPLTMLPNNLKAWWRASDITGVANNAAVTSWRDLAQYTAGCTLVQGVADRQPLLRKNSINGRAAVEFDGSNDFMSMTTPGLISNQPCTVFAVVKPDAAPTGNRFFLGGSGAFIGQTNVNGGANNWRAYAGTDIFTGAPTTIPHTIIWCLNGASSAVYMDGAPLVEGVAGGSSGLTSINIGSYSDGAQFFWDGLIAELAIFNVALNVDQRASLFNYARNFYGI